MLALKKNVNSEWETKILNCGGILKARGLGYDVVSVKKQRIARIWRGNRGRQSD